MLAEIVSLPLVSSVAVRLLACSAVLSWSSVLMVPPVPSPKVTLTAVPLLKEVKVKVLPLMLPAPADRPAVKLVAVPVLPLSPSAASELPVPEIVRSAVVPVLICSAPLAAIDDAVTPARGGQGRGAGRVAGRLHASGEIDGIEHVGDGALIEVDRRVAVAVGDDVAADARAGRNVGRQRRAARGEFPRPNITQHSAADSGKHSEQRSHRHSAHIPEPFACP